MKKLATLAAAFAVTTVLFAAPAFADSPGQLSNGDDNYKVKNVTTNGAYGKSVNLACDQTVKYSVLMANSDFGQLENVTVKASLPNNITISGTNVNGDTSSVSGSVAVSVPSNGTLKYTNGTTNYYVYNSDGTVKSSTTLADGVAGNGVNTGTLAGSTQARVYFQAKVDCPEVPQDKDITVCRLSDKQVVTIKESQYNADLYSKDLKDCADKPEQPGEITVCELESGKIVTISEDAYDSSKYSKDLKNAACVEEETPVVTELPQTGAGSLLAGLVLSTIAAGIAYALGSRKNLLG